MKAYLLFCVLPGLNGICWCLSVLVGLALIYFSVICASCIIDDDQIPDVLKCITKRLIIVSTMLLLGISIIPTEKEIIKIYAFNTVSKIQGIDKLPENIIKKLNILLTEDK